MYHPNSIWNRPIDTTPTIHPNSAYMIGTITNKPIYITAEVPVHRMTDYASTATYNVDYEAGGRAISAVPMPTSGVVETPYSDSKMVFLDLLAARGYSFYKYNHTPTPKTCQSAGWDDLSINGDGISCYRDGSAGWGGRATGWTYHTGLLALAEVQAQSIPHALAISIPAAQCHASLFDWPAFATDGAVASPNAIREGMRIQLDPAVSVNGLPMSNGGKAICRALQTYGAWVSDTNTDSITFYREAFISGTKPNQYVDDTPWQGILAETDLDSLPVSSLRVVQVVASAFYPTATGSPPPPIYSMQYIGASNIISNPGFEGTLGQWLEWNASKALGTAHYAGSYSALITASNTPFSIDSDQMGIASINTELFASCRARGNANVRMCIRENGLWQIEQFSAWTQLTTSQWNLIEVSHVVTLGEPVDIYLVGNSAASTYFELDDTWLATQAKVEGSPGAGTQIIYGMA